MHSNTTFAFHLGRITMRCITPTLFVAIILASLPATSVAGDDWTPEQGYTSLFNGKDLAGWKYGKETDLAGKIETADKRFRVEKGIIIAEEAKGTKDLDSIKVFNGELHLRMEFRAALKADSGVYIRGTQLQVRDFPRRKEMPQLKKFRNDDWNELDITVKHNVAVTKVNGKTLTDEDTVTLLVKNGKPTALLNYKPVEVTKIECTVGAVARCLCNGEFMENMSVATKSGRGVGLQAETGKFEFRRIRVKEMP
jgi:hypothetical protein